METFKGLVNAMNKKHGLRNVILKQRQYILL